MRHRHAVLAATTGIVVLAFGAPLAGSRLDLLPEASPGVARASATNEPTAEVAPLPEGSVVVDETVAELIAEPQLEAPRTVDGGVQGFAEAAIWLLASPAAAEDPMNAASAISGVINSTDAEILGRFDRTGGVEFRPSVGAYRVLAQAGDPAVPSNVMLEIVAPLRVGDASRWLIVGGVVAWTSDGWQIESIRPVETGQPVSGATSVSEFTEDDRSSVMPGAGWSAFSVSGG